MKLVDIPKKAKNSELVRVRLLLVEEQAAAFEPPRPSDPFDPLEVVVLAQSRGEASSDFVDRARRRIDVLERADRVVGEAILALGPAGDDSVLDARLLAARSLIAHMARAANAEIMLMAGSSDPQERHDLFALAGVLTSEAPGSISIRVLLEPGRSEPERKSGIQALLASTRPSDAVLAAG